MKAVFWAGLVLATLGLVWGGWMLRQSRAIREIYATDTVAVSQITDKHLAALRKLHIAWMPIESGGPAVDPIAPYGTPDMADDLGPILGTQNPVAIARFHREVAAAIPVFLEHGQIAAGTYRLAHLDNARMEQVIRRELPAARGDAVWASWPRLTPDGAFQMTDQHIALLHHLVVEWPDPNLRAASPFRGRPVPTVDFKRPFGDATAFERDMADILGWPHPAARDAALDRLYDQMWPALQAFLEHATIGTPRGGEQLTDRP
jgi:hypothetical protein